jgi:Xaa-Pro aminopeptidase
MESARVEAACVTDPLSIAYLTGFRANPHERLLALVVGQDASVLLVPDLEEEHARTHAQEVELIAWQDGDDPFRILRAAIGDPRLLAVEKEHLTLARWERLDAGEITDCSEALRRMREVKTSAELDLLRQAARHTDAVTEAIFNELRAGAAEVEVATRINALITETGSGLAFGTLVQAGPNSALPHLSPGPSRLAAGDLVLLDFGARHRGYNADTTRMGVVGEPDSEQRRLHQAVLDAHDRAIEAIRPGVSCGDVDAAARNSLLKAGLAERFIHRTGHGLGLDSHEGPNLEPGSEVRLEPGNVVTVEPGVYIPGWGGIRIEDDVAVTEAGAETLTTADRGLKVIQH